MMACPYCAHVDFVRPVQALIPRAQGRERAVLAETTAELNLSTLARLGNVSVAQALLNSSRRR